MTTYICHDKGPQQVSVMQQYSFKLHIDRIQMKETFCVLAPSGLEMIINLALTGI